LQLGLQLPFCSFFGRRKKRPGEQVNY